MFREDFKYYKRKCPPPDLSDVMNFENISYNIPKVEECPSPGLKPFKEWKIYEIPNKPGLKLIQNLFTARGQQYWVCRCLQDFTCKPQKLNLDNHGNLGQEESWWNVCNVDLARGNSLIKKLRWATLGYHHNWDTKEYSDSSRDPFPEDLAQLCSQVGQVVGFEKFCAQAAIINFYHMDSTLSGHTDHSELNRTAPLFSFSFGQSAVFLLGGPTLDEKPLAMFIHSGDVIIMSGESRLFYHGIPRILPSTATPWNDPMSSEESVIMTLDSKLFLSCQDNKFWKPFERYINNCRINMNVRQVLANGHKTLND